MRVGRKRRNAAAIARAFVDVNRRFAQVGRGGHRDTPVHQADGIMPVDMLFVIVRELPVVQIARTSHVHLVVDHVEVHVEDHAEQSVPAEHVAEQLGVERGSRGHHRSVAQHNPQPPDGWRDRTGPVRDAVRIHAQRAAHAEDVDRLHRLDRQPLPIEQPLHVRPHRAALHVHDLPGLVERDPVQPPHVEHQTVLDERLPTHAVPLASGGHLEAVVPGKL